MCAHRRLIWPWLVCLGLLSVPLEPLFAQRVLTGRVLQAPEGGPIIGGLITALDSTGREVGRTLSLSGGRFRLVHSARGRIQVQVAQIGYRPWRSDFLPMGPPDSLSLTLSIETVPVSLAELTVVGDDRCSERQLGGARALALWEEARKAFAATDATYHNEPILYDIDRQEQTLDEFGRLLSDTVYPVHASGVWSVRADTAELLFQSGFVRPRDPARGLPTWYGPDAVVLFHPRFIELHCLGYVEREADSLVGVAFEPVKGRDVPDVRGALWLDRRTLELRTMEFGYTGLGRWGAIEKVGGRLEFRRLGDGRWIIERWRMRAPVPRFDRYGSARLGGFEEVGEVVTIARANNLDTLWSGQRLLAPQPDSAAPEAQSAGSPGSSGRPITLKVSRRKVTGLSESPPYTLFRITGHNRSAATIRLRTVIVQSCVNILERCGPRQLNVILKPGEQRFLLTLRQWNTESHSGFQLAYRYDEVR